MASGEHPAPADGARHAYLARAALCLVALTVAASLGVALRSFDRANAASAELARANLGPGPPDAARVKRARQDFVAARRLNADSAVDLKEARALLLVRAPPGDAVALLQGVTRREPENANAWLLLSAALTKARDRRGAAVARARARELDPKVARSR